MLKVDGKVFLNVQEAVGWLLANNCIPFQCTAPYAANTEIGLGTIVNPSPAKVRIGSIIFFSDSKVSTVTGITENGFMVSDEYNSLVDDLVYVSNVALDASGHLIVTLSDGDEIDAGQIKMISSFSITASQHLLAVYNDGTTQDLGAIFSGNVNIAGTLTADSIIENMVGYSFVPVGASNLITSNIYVGVVKNGNKVTVVDYASLRRTGTVTDGYANLGNVLMPSSVVSKLYGDTIAGNANVLDYRKVNAVKKSDASAVALSVYIQKYGSGGISLGLTGLNTLDLNDEYVIRLENTFLLSDSLAS